MALVVRGAVAFIFPRAVAFVFRRPAACPRDPAWFHPKCRACSADRQELILFTCLSLRSLFTISPRRPAACPQDPAKLLSRKFLNPPLFFPTIYFSILK